MVETLAPVPDNHCFGCGGSNPHGLHLSFDLDHELRQVRGQFRLPADYQGSHGILHGGIIALLLDEAMGKLTRLHHVRAVTAELSIEYLRPIAAGENIAITAREQAHEGRNLHFEAEIRNADGQALARGHGRFVVIGQRL
ncbi:MAG: PaaI family thioesterase [Terriglobales bacterium]